MLIFGLLGMVSPEVGGANVQRCRVLLVPGAFGGDDAASGLFIQEKNYFAQYETFFKSKGCLTGKAILPADLTIEERSLLLRDQVRRFSSETRSVILIAHSEGGLDARFALKTLKMPQVKTLLSVGVPHQGTPLASWVLQQREQETLAYWLFRLVFQYDFKKLRFAGEMTPDFLARHESHFSKLDGVQYASAQAVCETHCHPLLRLLSRWIPVPDGDGVIPSSSQLFGKNLGQFDLDHVSTVGVDRAKDQERQRLLTRFWQEMQ